jgi:hypothetical protein
MLDDIDLRVANPSGSGLSEPMSVYQQALGDVERRTVSEHLIEVSVRESAGLTFQLVLCVEYHYGAASLGVDDVWLDRDSFSRIEVRGEADGGDTRTASQSLTQGGTHDAIFKVPGHGRERLLARYRA